MFSKSSAGPFFSSTRRAMAPSSRSQSTSAVIRRSSPSLSSRPSHSRRSANGIVILLYRNRARRALRIAVHDATTDHREPADQLPDLGQRRRERILLEHGEIRLTSRCEDAALSLGERDEG